MKFTGISIDGIDIMLENEHYVLHKNGVKINCNIGELNICVPEFKRYSNESFQQLEVI